MGNLSCEMLFKSIIGSKDNYVYKSKILDPKLLVRKSCLAR
jgi:hypothetical protein